MIPYRWRLGLAVAVGIIGWRLALALQAPAATRALIGWNAGALFYLAAAWALFLTADGARLRARAARQDEHRGVILVLGLLAIAASLAAILSAMLQVQGESATTKRVVLGLAIATLATSWAVLQALFAAHYAHRHFQAIERHGEGAGFLFPGEAPTSYLDFVYLAICIGATAQISDVSVARTPLRNLVTAHAVTAFFYNTAVLALGINILSGLIGH